MFTDHHRHTVAEESQSREAALDRTIEDSFPASDPPSSIPNPHSHEDPHPDHVTGKHVTPDCANKMPRSEAFPATRKRTCRADARRQAKERQMTEAHKIHVVVNATEWSSQGLVESLSTGLLSRRLGL